jgi:hypothetical protein
LDGWPDQSNGKLAKRDNMTDTSAARHASARPAHRKFDFGIGSISLARDADPCNGSLPEEATSSTNQNPNAQTPVSTKTHKDNVSNATPHHHHTTAAEKTAGKTLAWLPFAHPRQVVA